mmetsp:Transcript_64628/g.162635  ORF Transcript_64628/g.162635 Transcript_64628/m.162635 type:complete len:100 (-) Transcript_64628:11-310(-)
MSILMVGLGKLLTKLLLGLPTTTGSKQEPADELAVTGGLCRHSPRRAFQWPRPEAMLMLCAARCLTAQARARRSGATEPDPEHGGSGTCGDLSGFPDLI